MQVLKRAPFPQISLILLLLGLLIGGVFAQCVLTPIPAHGQGYEDFTTYSIIDPEGNLTVSTEDKKQILSRVKHEN